MRDMKPTPWAGTPIRNVRPGQPFDLRPFVVVGFRGILCLGEVGCWMRAMAVAWDFRASDSSDAHWMAELRAEVMRPDLERLDRYDAERVRRRFLDAFVPAHTRVIVAAGQDIGLVALRPEPDAVWLEHFYLAPSYQGLGIGRDVLARVMAEGDVSKPLLLRRSPRQPGPPPIRAPRIHSGSRGSCRRLPQSPSTHDCPKVVRVTGYTGHRLARISWSG